MNKKTLWSIVGLIVLLCVVLYALSLKEPKPDATSFTFECLSGNTMTVSYGGKDNEVALVTNAGQGYSLKRAESASGARYTNDDESVVFWEHAGEVTLEKNGKEIETNCIIPRN